MPVEAKPFLLMKNPQANITQVAVVRPSAGEWKVIVEDGSAPVTSLKVADAIAKPKIDVRVTGKGAGASSPTTSPRTRRRRSRSSSAARAPPARSARPASWPAR